MNLARVVFVVMFVTFLSMLVYGVSAQQPSIEPSPTIQWSTDNLVHFDLSVWSSCQITISRSGKVTLERCKDVDDAARTFWKAVEQNFPCKGAQ